MYRRASALLSTGVLVAGLRSGADAPRYRGAVIPNELVFGGWGCLEQGGHGPQGIRPALDGGTSSRPSKRGGGPAVQELCLA